MLRMGRRTTVYLGYQGWFAANVPIVPEIPLPPALLSLPSERIICLVKNHDLPGYLLNRLAGNVDLRPAMLDTFLSRVTKLLLDVRQ